MQACKVDTGEYQVREHEAQKNKTEQKLGFNKNEKDKISVAMKKMKYGLVTKEEGQAVGTCTRKTSKANS